MGVRVESQPSSVYSSWNIDVHTDRRTDGHGYFIWSKWSELPPLQRCKDLTAINISSARVYKYNLWFIKKYILISVHPCPVCRRNSSQANTLSYGTKALWYRFTALVLFIMINLAWTLIYCIDRNTYTPDFPRLLISQVQTKRQSFLISTLVIYGTFKKNTKPLTLPLS